MKHFFSLIMMFTTAAIWSQTNTFNGAEDTNWNNGNNWSLNLIPTSLNDVVIPTGKSVTVSGTPATAKSLQLAGTAILTLIGGNLSVTQTANITANAAISWVSGNLGGGGTINNLGTINLVPFGSKELVGGTTLNNSGTMSISTDWTLMITDGTLNNLPAGIIDLQVSGASIESNGSGLHVFNNAGLLKKTGTSSASILADMTNTGTVSVEGGILQFNDPDIVLNGGVYNVSAGANLFWTSTLRLAGNVTGNIAGELNWTGTMNVPVAASANFSGTGIVNWGSGHLGGGGVFTNMGTLLMTPAYPGNKSIDDGTTFNNTGTIRISTDWTLSVSNGTMNNLPSGIIDFTTTGSAIDKGTIAGNHSFINTGLIKKSGGAGTAIISADLTNSATISAEVGYLDLYGTLAILNGGTYNAFTDAHIRWYSNVQCAGILTGNLDGNIDWNSGVSVPVAASFNFTGSGGVYWNGGELNGGGQLTNTSKLFQSAGGNKIINGNTTLNNTGTFTFLSDSGLMIENGTINNTVSGVIDFQVAALIASGAGMHAINNAGLFKKTASTGTLTVNAVTTNTGTIQSSFGRIVFEKLNNTLTGTVTGTAEVQFSNGANFTNDGIFAPGGNPGALVVATDYDSTASTRIAVELYGLAQDTQYDHLAVWGNAAMNGSVVVDLHFAPAIGNQFIIATAAAITTCNLAPTAIATFNGSQYVFSVGCQNDNKVVLELTAILAAKDNVLNSGLTLYPNPASGSINLRNESGKALTSIAISDLSGRNVINLIPQNNTLQKIGLDSLAAGTYLVKITSGNNSAVKKIIVE